MEQPFNFGFLGLTNAANKVQTWGQMHSIKSCKSDLQIFLYFQKKLRQSLQNSRSTVGPSHFENEIAFNLG